MSNDFSIDLGAALPYLEQRILGLFGRDSESVAWQSRLKNMIRLSGEQAAYVQCVGMHTPIPITRIYQPTRLKRSESATPSLENIGTGSPASDVEIDVADVLAADKDAIVFAGPGWGKTTLIHRLYCSLAQRSNLTPVLFTLRWPGVVEDFQEFIDRLARSSSSNKKLVLLVDGYDEILEEARQQVSRALLLFSSLKRGMFILTCRTFYDVYELKTDRYSLCPFKRYDAVNFVRSFASIYDAPLDAEKTVSDLERRGFQDFLAHPLMLALVCILKTGPNQEIPRRAIGLIRRALETLTFRWDDAKRVRRESSIPLDGEERIRCLMRIAYGMHGLAAPWTEVERLIRDHLKLIQLPRLNPTKLLEELARWYGILVPVGDSRWQFVHRTIHDYLAARYWVESGEFSAGEVREWNTRAGYAACLLPDATECIVRMLAESRSAIAFRECLYNRAPFAVNTVAKAVVSRAARLGNFVLERSELSLHVRSDDDFFNAASPELLRSFVEIGSTAGEAAGDAVTLLALAELHARGIKASASILHHTLRGEYGFRPNLTIDAAGYKAFGFSDVIGI